jgi:hypothetical protein
VPTYVSEIEEQVLEGIDRADEIAQASISGLRMVTEQVALMLPELPSMPFAELVPAPREIIRASFAVADRIVDSQRRFADGLVDALAPVTNKLMPWTKGRESGKPSEGKAMQSQRSEAA